MLMKHSFFFLQQINLASIIPSRLIPDSATCKYSNNFIHSLYLLYLFTTGYKIPVNVANAMQAYMAHLPLSTANSESIIIIL